MEDVGAWEIRWEAAIKNMGWEVDLNYLKASD